MKAWVLFSMIIMAGCSGELLPGNGDRGFPTQKDSGPAPADQSKRFDMGRQDPDLGTDSAQDLRDRREDLPPAGPCENVLCQASEICDPNTSECICREGFIDGGAECVQAPPGDPATREKADMCAKWIEGVTSSPNAKWESDDQACGTGTLNRDAIDDTIRRINIYRWLSGLAGVTDNPDHHQAQMECATMMSNQGQLSHTPPSSFTCYTQNGAAAAGRSNIALGYTSSDRAIDGYMSDSRTASLGHRRWLLNGPLGRVGVGYSGSGQCLSVFDNSGTTTRDWTSFPNHGFTPFGLSQLIWSFQSNRGGLAADATATVVRVSDGMVMPVNTEILGGGGRPATLKILRMDWMPEVNQTYRVTITNYNGNELTYEILPVDC